MVVGAVEVVEEEEDNIVVVEVVGNIEIVEVEGSMVVVVVVLELDPQKRL
jgi:hypothetical protein